MARNAKSIRFSDGESFMEEEPQFVNDAPITEAYDPMDDGDLPYIPSMGNSRVNKQQMYTNNRKPLNQNAFIDINNIQNYAQQPSNNQSASDQQAFQRTLAEATAKARAAQKFDANAAVGVINQMNGVVDVFNEIDQSTSANGDVDRYGIEVAIKSMNSAISTLNDIEYWLPKDQMTNLASLKKISKPIIQALKAYTDTISKMK